MKKSLWFALALSAIVAFTSSVFAAEKTEGKGRGPSVEERLKNMAEKLKLTDEQKAKIEPIMKEEGTKLAALREDPAPREEKVKKMLEIRKEIAARIKPILTAEQAEQYEKYQAEIAAKRKKQ
ncbi:MAG: hypothetical protein EBS05_10660 [Proteobacteria bacterium]|nr:hypothetical protein [Pseudomonadota bacterium]